MAATLNALMARHGRRCARPSLALAHWSWRFPRRACQAANQPSAQLRRRAGVRPARPARRGCGPHPSPCRRATPAAADRRSSARPRPARRRWPDGAGGCPSGRRRRACHRSGSGIDGETSTTSSRPSSGWARGATSQAPRCWAFITATTRPLHHDRRATRWATNQCWRPSSSTEPRSAGQPHRVVPSARRARSPLPPTVRHRSPPSSPSGGSGSPRRAGRLDSGRGPRRRSSRPRRRPAAARARPRARPARSSRSGGQVDRLRSPPAAPARRPSVARRAAHGRRRDHAPEQGVGGGPGAWPGCPPPGPRRRSGGAGR